ncbi:hypothetical protein HUJ05_012883 [Dendroctonus ponderosae]|nr:hypothetical protein HUJ05_012883 [Dendroctonus ponderosae]
MKNIDIRVYLKKENSGCRSQKTKVSTKENISKFLVKGTRRNELHVKVATIFCLELVISRN